MRIDNLNDSPSARQAQTVRKHGTKSPGGRTSISEGAFEVRSNEGLLVQGSQKVSGWLVVTGTLKVVGEFLLEGITTITGDVAITGKLLINGLAELTKTLTVKTGGSIKVEGANPITLSQVAGAAQIQLGDAKLVGGVNGFALGVGTRVFYSTLGGAVVQGGTNEVAVEASTGTTVTGPLKATNATVSLTNLPPKAGAVANVHIDSAGRLWRIP